MCSDCKFNTVNLTPILSFVLKVCNLAGLFTCEYCWLFAISLFLSFLDDFSCKLTKLFLIFQEMVSVESFIELVKKRDLGRLKFAIRETNFDINSRDEVNTIFSTFLGPKFNNVFLLV